MSCKPFKADHDAAQLQRLTLYLMNNLLQEMLFCNFMLTCESHGCREFFEFDEVAADPIDAWSIRAAAVAQSDGWVIGHTGLVKCPKCAAAALESR